MNIKDLEQISDMKAEIYILEKRLQKCYSKSNEYVGDTAKDYSTGYERIITIRGYGFMDNKKADRLSALIKKQKEILDDKVIVAEEFVASITDSRIRMLVSLRYIDGESWRTAARRVYGNPCEDRARMAVKRFFEKI